VAGTALVAHLIGLPVASAVVALSASNTFSLLTWTMAALLSAVVSRRIAAEQRRLGELGAAHAAHARIRVDMDRSLTDVARRARPVLADIAQEASHGDLSVPTRMQARLLEAELRDEIRAPVFTGTPVVDMARAARRRGVEVVLMDDSGVHDLSEEARDQVVREACAQLRTTDRGRVVVRVFPPGRPELATIVVNGARMVVETDGVSVDESAAGG